MPDVYCGPAPAPQTLLLAWNFDPVALALCAAISLAMCAVAPFAGGAAVRAAREG